MARQCSTSEAREIDVLCDARRQGTSIYILSLTALYLQPRLRCFQTSPWLIDRFVVCPCRSLELPFVLLN
jgi:hypothetical protein